MSATTAQAIRHERWCTDHQHGDADPETHLEEHDRCEQVITRQHGLEVVIEEWDDTGLKANLYADDVALSAEQAREMAAALVRAAEVLDGMGK